MAPLIRNAWHVITESATVDCTWRSIKALARPLACFRAETGDPAIAVSSNNWAERHGPSCNRALAPRKALERGTGAVSSSLHVAHAITAEEEPVLHAAHRTHRHVRHFGASMVT